MNPDLLRSHKRENLLQALLLIAGMAGVMAVVGLLFAGRTGVVWALGFAAVSALIAPIVSPKIVLQMYGARPIRPGEAPELEALFGALVERSGLSRAPSLHYIRARMPNAFAVGSGRSAAIAVTDGLLRMMNPRELAGVLAHELSHVRFHDTRLMALGDVFSRMTVFMSHMGQLLLLLSLPAILFGAAIIPLWGVLALLFAPEASALMQLALSRTREFNADLGAVELTGDPGGLASALRKLERAQFGPWWQRVFWPYKASEPSLLRTHPVTEERIERLMRLAADPAVPGMPLDPDEVPSARRVVPELFPRVTAGPRWHHASGLWY